MGASKIGVLFRGPSMRVPTILGPYYLPLIVGNSHIKSDRLLGGAVLKLSLRLRDVDEMINTGTKMVLKKDAE